MCKRGVGGKGGVLGKELKQRCVLVVLLFPREKKKKSKEEGAAEEGAEAADAAADNGSGADEQEDEDSDDGVSDGDGRVLHLLVLIRHQGLAQADLRAQWEL